jgi:hypothetical protein
VKFVFIPPILIYHALSSYVIETRLFTNARKSRKLAGFGIYAPHPLHFSCSNTCVGQEDSSNRTFVAHGVYVFMRNSLSVPFASQILRGFDWPNEEDEREREREKERKRERVRERERERER